MKAVLSWRKRQRTPSKLFVRSGPCNRFWDCHFYTALQSKTTLILSGFYDDKHHGAVDTKSDHRPIPSLPEEQVRRSY